MSPDGVIFVHDCNPPTRAHVERRDGGAWNGDVWKVVYYLRCNRKDLRLVTLDCDWGLCVLKGFNSRRTGDMLADLAVNDTDAVSVDHVKGLDYSILEESRQAILNLTPPVLTRLNYHI
jgi:hypothetical protein